MPLKLNDSGLIARLYRAIVKIALRRNLEDLMNIRLLIGLLLTTLFFDLFCLHMRVNKIESQFRDMLYFVANNLDITKDSTGQQYRKNEDD
jgi:hypothetical protein